MPELPDIALYLHALAPRILGARLERVRIASPFLLRTTAPPIAEIEGRVVRAVRRLGKRIVIGFDGDVYAVLHLMIAGRLRWQASGAAIPRRIGLAAFDFPAGTLLWTEAGTKHRAARETLTTWIARLRTEAGDGFPERVTAFREGMAVHGRYRQPCPACGSPVQRIRYAENEVNYCATCQTGGRLLADRALSQLLKADWPRSLDQWEARANL